MPTTYQDTPRVYRGEEGGTEEVLVPSLVEGKDDVSETRDETKWVVMLGETGGTRSLSIFRERRIVDKRWGQKTTIIKM